MFAYIKLLYDNIRLKRVIIVSSDSDISVISLYQSVTNLTFLDALWFKAGTGEDQRCIPIHILASELGLSICCLLPAMYGGCDSSSSFSHIGKMTTFQTLKNKIDKLPNMIEKFPSLSVKYCLLLLTHPLNALVLHLRRASIFFLNSFTSFIKITKYTIEKTFSMHKIPLFT